MISPEARPFRRACPTLWSALVLTVLGAAPAVAQTTVTAPLRVPDMHRDQPRQGVTRQLVCRGKAGLRLTTRPDSGADPRLVKVSLAYQRITGPAGVEYDGVEPGTCSWNQLGQADMPPEPGIVHFEITREGSAYVPDPVTFAEYMGKPEHYWLFYVDDVTNIAISHGSWRGRFWAGDNVRDANRTASTALFQRQELRCRGGSGLAFSRGAGAGDNLVAMRLDYTVASRAAGAAGLGLTPGTCAWVDRTGARQEPGRVTFVTAGNAQLRQAQSGSAVDRSFTAAERWPDVHTIPRYMESSAHYWSFTVVLVDPDSAVAHAAWKRSFGELLTSRPPGDASRSVRLPAESSVADRYEPGDGAATSRVQAAFDIRNVQVTAGLEGVVIRFEAAANVAPTVQVNVAAPAGAAGSYTFSGTPTPLVVSGTPGGSMVRYVAASNAPLARGTRYWYIISAPEGTISRANQETGEFRTLAQYLTVGITEINIISDGDAESNGELYFEMRSCPAILNRVIAGSYSQPLDWTEGRHALSVELTPRMGGQDADGRIGIGPSVPDRFRLLIAGLEDDDETFDFGGNTRVLQNTFSCDRNPDLQPGSNSAMEWNSIAMDFDLTKYPGAKATETFLRRSKPLAGGSRLMFEVRGYVTVERR